MEDMSASSEGVADVASLSFEQARDELDSHLKAAGGVPNPRTEMIWVEA